MPTSISRRTVLKTGTALGGVAVLSAHRPGRAAAARDGIVVALERDLQNLDPANRTGPADVNVILAVCQNLVKFKPGSLEYENDAAEEIKQVSDTQIDFKLRPGQMFGGGYGEMTAEDVKFSFERFIKPGPDGKKVAYADDWLALESVEVTGTHTGSIHLKNPAPALWIITLCDGSGSILSKKAFDALGGKIATTLIGSGPYLLQDWTPRERFTLAANPDFKGPVKGSFAKIEGRPITELKTAQLAFLADEVHFTRIDPAAARSVEEPGKSEVIQLPGIDYVWLGPNIEKKPFDDVKVRKAIRLGIDIDAILLSAYGGLAPRANALLAPALLGYWKDAPVYKRDVEAAKKLLAEAGLGSGFKTRLTILSGAIPEAIAAVVQANLAEIGVDVQIEALDPGAYWSLGENDGSKDLELSLIEYSGKFDPSFQTQWFVSSQIGQWNWQRWKNPEFDKLHEEAGQTTDNAKREAMYLKMQQLMDESAAFVWITHNLNAFVTKSWLEPGLLPNGNNWQYPFFKEA